MMKTKKVLIGCEMSGRVTAAMLDKGVNAYSCDIIPTIGPRPDRHIIGDIFDVLEGDKWDAIIAFTPCTHLTNSGAIYRQIKKADGRLEAGYNFFMRIWNMPHKIVCLENPVGIVSSQFALDKYMPGRRALQPSQYVCWTMFGDDRKKRTCLWLRGLPLLLPTTADGVGKPFQKWAIGSCPSQKKQHSLMSPFMAKAMAEQWADYLK